MRFKPPKNAAGFWRNNKKSKGGPAATYQGIPQKMDPKMIKRLLKLISEGNYLNVACGSVGLKPQTLTVWRKLGAQGLKPYDAFLKKFEAAMHDAEVAAVSAWRAGFYGKDGWRASAEFLARRKTGRWARPDEQFMARQAARDGSKTTVWPLKLAIIQSIPKGSVLASSETISDDDA